MEWYEQTPAEFLGFTTADKRGKTAQELLELGGELGKFGTRIAGFMGLDYGLSTLAGRNPDYNPLYKLAEKAVNMGYSNPSMTGLVGEGMRTVNPRAVSVVKGLSNVSKGAGVLQDAMHAMFSGPQFEYGPTSTYPVKLSRLAPALNRIAPSVGNYMVDMPTFNPMNLARIGLNGARFAANLALAPIPMSYWYISANRPESYQEWLGNRMAQQDVDMTVPRNGKMVNYNPRNGLSKNSSQIINKSFYPTGEFADGTDLLSVEDKFAAVEADKNSTSSVPKTIQEGFNKWLEDHQQQMVANGLD